MATDPPNDRLDRNLHTIDTHPRTHAPLHPRLYARTITPTLFQLKVPSLEFFHLQQVILRSIAPVLSQLPKWIELGAYLEFKDDEIRLCEMCHEVCEFIFFKLIQYNSEGMELCGNCLEKNKEKTPWKVYLREGLVMLLSSLNHIVCTPGSGEILELDLKENNMPGLPLSAPLLSSSNSGFQSCSFDQLSPSGPFLISSPSEPLPIAPPSEPVLYRSNSEPEPVLYRSNSESLLYKSNAEPVLFTSNAEPVLFTTNSEPLVFTPNTVPQAFSPSPNSLAYTPLSEPLSFPSNSVPLDFNQSPEPSAFTSNSESYTYTTDSLPSDFTPTSEPPAFPPKTELVSFTQIAESLPPPVSNPEKVAKAPTKSCKKVSDCVLVDRMRTIVHQDCRIGKELFTTGIELADRYNSCYNHETIHVRRVFEAMKTLGFSASKDTMQVQVQSVRRKVKLIYGLAFK
ncbi:hypothetical protein MPTK1_1g11580 [Marchantia polymorpha subsp. ruderalis]|uniref:Uncharacterized protein n=2 Tax=Marchantia polymorpha TaxID=3197 RepID=A0A176WK01_MARPO|nr:hypothetical protein AXG93_3822s1340 [Marchantia polymorpha subsp. ruderalis]PTQ45529.1 hypothetical protein MARPO_0014s0068 [Marchantia polymorpha]PTQ45530.1 hypothetical protein MARPO_0014s0068 [Marchantia polymorpha]BBM98191.1 hypothetical protein Mp_1g11580 [Marchantia polymorpha subsp. ruderalis]|eukprot:PTQ45529.1 hypothetical protein MARPO_0014s0068 [Marchantia polymorpha]